MKRTFLAKYPEQIPEEFLRLFDGASIYDSSCSNAARVYFIDKNGGYYLKVSDKGCLRAEAELTRYFHKKKIGAEVISYYSDETDYLLTSSVKGEDCTFGEYLSEPVRLATLLGETLRMLHETDASDCPVKNRIESYVYLAEQNYKTGNFNHSHFPDSFGYTSPEEAYEVAMAGKSALKNDVLIHGDYCLPNIMLDNFHFSGFIDLGSSGIGDRHIDIFWGLWSLEFNLKTDKYADTFLSAYGRELINMDVLKTVAAFEVFG